MTSIPVFVGLDYHKDSVHVCVLNAAGRQLMNRECLNDWQPIAKAVGRYGVPKRVAIEACTGAAHLADELIARAGWPVRLAHPGYVARLKQSPDKSDYSDARLLADLERVGYLPAVWLAPEQIRELRRVVRYRQQLVAERRNVKLRVSALLREQRLFIQGRAWTKAWRKCVVGLPELSPQARWIIERQVARHDQLDAEIQLVNTRLEAMTQGDPVVAKLLQQPGVGLITAATLRAEIGRFDRFRRGKQLARFCGLSPRNASSGQRQADAGLIKAGNPQLRACIIEAAHRLLRFDLRWGELGSQLLARGKAKCVVIAALANRWIRGLHHELTSLAAAA
jgi:transposase